VYHSPGLGAPPMAGKLLNDRQLDLPKLAFAANVLAGSDTFDGISRELACCRALSVELPAMLGKVKVLVVKAVPLPMFGKVGPVNRNDMQKEARCRVRGAAPLFDVNQRPVAEIQVECGADGRFAGKGQQLR